MAVLAALLAGGVAQASAQPQLPPGWGAYHWGGAHGEDAMQRLAGAQGQLAAQGFTTARLVLSPRLRNGRPADNPYGLRIDASAPGCAPTDPFLPCAIRQPAVQAAIAPPALRTVVLTAYDAAAIGAQGESARYLDPDFWRDDAGRDAVRREYRELTLALYQTQQRSGKTFVIASWEADNQAYCGAFLRYAQDAALRRQCGDLSTRAQALGALREWFRARQAGIREGRALAAAAGLGGMTVADGIEFNANTLTYDYRVDGRPMPSVLRDIVPALRPDVVLYSAYDSQHRGAMAGDLRQLRDWLATAAPGALFGIGEFGWRGQGTDFLAATRLLATAQEVLQVGLPIVVLWAAFDPPGDPPAHDYGMLNADATPRRVLRMLQDCLVPAPPVSTPPDATPRQRARETCH
ncbi:MAG: hypothetical protein JNM97_20030 [Rhodoferax sp.]|nr:hypothetical protein [Rhodoferax sp.]